MIEILLIVVLTFVVFGVAAWRDHQQKEEDYLRTEYEQQLEEDWDDYWQMVAEGIHGSWQTSNDWELRYGVRSADDLPTFDMGFE